MAVQAQGDLRVLKAVVGIMGVLIVLGTAVVVGTVVQRVYATIARPSMPVVAGGLAPGEHIEGIAGAGGDVAIWVKGPKGDRVLLLDPASGRMRVALDGAK